MTAKKMMTEQTTIKTTRRYKMMTIKMSRQVERRRISRASQALETLSSVPHASQA